jgi:two-component system response regulator PilR (NtrC family)
LLKKTQHLNALLSPSALEALHSYSFPGNVRELENILQRAATLCEDNLITADNLEFMPGATDPAEQLESAAASEPPIHRGRLDLDADFSLEKHLEAIEIDAIEKALEETRWNKTACSKETWYVI